MWNSTPTRTKIRFSVYSVYSVVYFLRSSHVGFHTNEDEKDFLNGFNEI